MVKQTVKKRRKPGKTRFEVAEYIEKMITDQNFKTGDKLPGLRQLAKETDSAVPTVEKAVQLLSGKGILRTHNKSGTFVSDLSVTGEAREPVEMAQWLPENHIPRLKILVQGDDRLTKDKWGPVLRQIERNLPPYNLDIYYRNLPDGEYLGEEDFDLAIIQQWKLYECTDKGLFMSLEKCQSPMIEQLHKIPHNFMNMGKVRGTLCAVPVISSILLLFMNLDMLERDERPLSPNQLNPTDIDDFIQLLTTLRKERFESPVINSINPKMLLYAYGLKEEWKDRCSFDTACVRKTLNVLKDLYETDVFIREQSILDCMNCFLDKKIPLFVMPSGCLGEIFDRADFNLKVIPMTVSNGDYSGGVEVVAVSKHTKQKDKCFHLINTLISSSIQSIIAKTRMDLPIRRENIMDAVGNKKEKKFYDSLDTVFENITTELPGETFPLFLDFIQSVFYQEVALYVLGRQDEQTVIDNLEKEKERYMRENNENIQE